MLSRIVAGVDGSAASLAAARLAAAEADAEHRTLHLVHARLPVADYALLLPPVAAAADTAGRSLVAAVGDDLRRRHPGLDVRLTVTDAGAGPALLRASRSAGGLVIGRTGLHPAGRSPTGSTVTRVVAAAAGPVIVVGPRLPRQGPVVLGFDPADPRAAAVPYAFAAARRRGTTLRVCCVREPQRGPWPDDAAARGALSEAIAPWRRVYADVPVAVDVLAGVDPAAGLLDASAAARLVVVGDPGAADAGPAGRLPEVLIGNAACPVALVRPPRRHGRRPEPGPKARGRGPESSGPLASGPRRSECQVPASM
ncbi:universal stress protein [Dactylosporangium sp. CA-052675]|uniref:universal stress protein n=1 Tax=Dactylosporangium sp. CA-052675 TaxID=3239927 RepID=UPI003D8C29B9